MKSYLTFSTSPNNKLDWNVNKLGGKSQTNVTVTSHLIPKSSLLSETRWSTWCTALVECSNYMATPFLMQDLNAAGQAYMHLVDCKDVKLLTLPTPTPSTTAHIKGWALIRPLHHPTTSQNFWRVLWKKRRWDVYWEVDILMFMFVTEYQSHSRYGAIRREVSEENSFPSHNILKTTSR